MSEKSVLFMYNNFEEAERDEINREEAPRERE